MAVAVVACTLVAFLKVTLEGDSFYHTLKNKLFYNRSEQFLKLNTISVKIAEFENYIS